MSVDAPSSRAPEPRPAAATPAKAGGGPGAACPSAAEPIRAAGAPSGDELPRDRRDGVRSAGLSPEARVRASLDRAVLDALASHGDPGSVALAAVDTVATLFGCRRVSLGLVDGGDVKLLAVSGECRPDGRRATTRHLADVMGEAARYGGRRLPGGDGAAAPADERAAHRRLHASTGALPLLSLARASAGGGRAVVVLERPAGRPFTDAEEALARTALRPALALTATLHARGHGLAGRARTSLRAAVDALAQRRVPARTALVPVTLVALAFASLVPLPYRVGGRVTVEASDRQVLVAPEAGHIRTAHARAGDTVAADELLATLDDREHALAIDRWRSEVVKNRAEQSRALAGHDRVELARLRADAARIEAELGLVEARRARGEIRAPFAGVVLSGDPTRSLGAPVEAGDVLFEIGAGARELSVAVDERDIALVATGARARVRMAAAPREVRVARLEPIVPVAVDADGRHVFRVPAVLIDDGDVPSPGMQGVARIEAGRRPLASAWTRTLRERALLLAWRLGLVR